MCGIVALFAREASPPLGEALVRMTAAVAHRGPDDAGSVLLDGRRGTVVAAGQASWTVGLGHRRLAILDVTPSGHQPMSYRDRTWIVFNGEIYNYRELRAELEASGHRFRSSSDTEVILAAYDEWGTGCFARFRGMWGLVLVDLARRQAVLGRDRLGIKPLYVWQGDGAVAVVSEPKQLLEVPGFRARLDVRAAGEYLATGYEDPGRSLFADVRPVEAGTFRVLGLDDLGLGSAAPYWFPERIQPTIRDERDAAAAFARTLGESVALHLRSDVPVGCALSGGLDSCSLAVLMSRAAEGDHLHTFTVTFPGHEADEREYAEAALASARVSPHFITPSPEGFLADLDRFVWSHDEPVGSLSMYAGYCLARLTRAEGVKVLLNGQGGDEALFGYWQSYLMYLRDLAYAGRALALVGHLAGALLPGGNPQLLRQVPTMLARYRARRAGQRLVRLRRDPGPAGSGILREVTDLDEHGRRLYELRRLFLPRLLKWDDRNSMAFSVEGRYPFLDHELLELCLAFSPSLLYRRGWTKWPMRLGLTGVLPDKIRLRRTKLGFEVPQRRWLRGPLRATFESWLGAERPAWEAIEREDVRHLARRTWADDEAPGAELAAEALFRAFVFDRWMERFRVTA